MPESASSSAMKVAWRTSRPITVASRTRRLGILATFSLATNSVIRLEFTRMLAACVSLQRDSKYASVLTFSLIGEDPETLL